MHEVELPLTARGLGDRLAQLRARVLDRGYGGYRVRPAWALMDRHEWRAKALFLLGVPATLALTVWLSLWANLASFAPFPFVGLLMAIGGYGADPRVAHRADPLPQVLTHVPAAGTHGRRS